MANKSIVWFLIVICGMALLGIALLVVGVARFVDERDVVEQSKIDTGSNSVRFDVAQRLCIDDRLYVLVTGMEAGGRSFQGIAMAPVFDQRGAVARCGSVNGGVNGEAK